MAGSSTYTFQLLVDGAQGIQEARNFRDAWNREMGALGKPMTSAQQFAAMKTGADIAANSLLAVGTAGAAAAVGAVKLAADFDGSMRNVNSVAQLSEGQFQALKGEVLDFALTTRATTTEVAGALYNVVSAGLSLETAVQVPVTKVRELADGSKELYTETLKTSEGMAVMQMASRAAGAGLADTAETSRLLIGALSAYGLGVEEAGRVTDLFLYTANKGQTTLPQLAAQLGDVFPSAHAAGLSLEEVTASISLLTNKGLSTAEATTSLNGAIISLLSPSDALAEVLKRAGYESGVAALQELGWAGVMQLVSRETGGAADKVAALFGERRAQRAVFNLAANDAKELSAAIKDFGENAAGAVELARAEQYKSLAANLEKLRNAAEVTAISMGDLFLPSIVETAISLTKGIQDLGEAFRALPKDEQQRWVNVGLWITGAALATGTLIKAVIAGVDAYNKLTAAVKAYQLAQATGGTGGAVGGVAGRVIPPVAMVAATVVGVNMIERAVLPDYDKRVEQGEKIRNQAKELAAALAEEAKGTGDLSEKSKALAADLQLTMRTAERTGIAWTEYEPKIAAIRAEYERLSAVKAPALGMGDLQLYEAGQMAELIRKQKRAYDDARLAADQLRQVEEQRRLVLKALDEKEQRAREAVSTSGPERGQMGGLNTYSLWQGLGPFAGEPVDQPELSTVDIAAEYRKQSEEMAKVREEVTKEQDRLLKEAQQQLQQRMQSLAGVMQSSTAEMLQPSGAYTALDVLDQQMGTYASRWDEWGKRMSDIAEKGGESTWLKFTTVPPAVMAKGEDTIKAWAAEQSRLFYTGMKPEAVDWGSFVENYKTALTEKQGAERMRQEAIHQVQQALGTGEISQDVFKEVYGAQFGAAMWDPTASPIMMQLLGGSPDSFKGALKDAVGSAVSEVFSDPRIFQTGQTPFILQSTGLLPPPVGTGKTTPPPDYLPGGAGISQGNPWQQAGTEGAAGQALMNQMLGDQAAASAQFNDWLSKGVAGAATPDAFAGIGQQIAGSLQTSLTVGLTSIKWSESIIVSMRTELDANFEAGMRPLCVSVGKQISNYLGEGVAQGAFGKAIVAEVLKQIADAAER